MAGRAWMALCSLISLPFWEKRPAGRPWHVAENLNYPNDLRGPDGQAFPLPSNFRGWTNRLKAMMDGANGIDIIGEFLKGASRPF
jgi:hypothetical protein